MSDRFDRDDDAGWLLLWNLGVLIGLIGLPTLLGFFAGRSIEGSAHAPALPWRFLFAALGVIVGALAAWRTLAPKASRTRD